MPHKLIGVGVSRTIEFEGEIEGKIADENRGIWKGTQLQYYFSNDGANQQGPLPREGLLAAGVTPQSMVWREGMSAWTPAGQLPELADLFSNQPPPAPEASPRVHGQSMNLPPGGVVQPTFAAPISTQQTNGMATASLVCGIIGLFCCCAIVPSVLAVVFGHIARGQIKEGKGTGDGIAVAGLVMGYIGLLMGVSGNLLKLLGLVGTAMTNTQFPTP